MPLSSTHSGFFSKYCDPAGQGALMEPLCVAVQEPAVEFIFLSLIPFMDWIELSLFQVIKLCINLQTECHIGEGREWTNETGTWCKERTGRRG